jgi:hypothetical protein
MFDVEIKNGAMINEVRGRTIASEIRSTHNGPCPGHIFQEIQNKDFLCRVVPASTGMVPHNSNAIVRLHFSSTIAPSLVATANQQAPIPHLTLQACVLFIFYMFTPILFLLPFFPARLGNVSGQTRKSK